MIFPLLMVGVLGVAEARECPTSSRLIRISATGDVLVHKPLYENAIGHQKRFRALWSDLLPVLQSADYTVANLEGPVAPGVAVGGKAVPDVGFVHDGRVYSGTNMIFNYHPHLLTDLKASGVDLVTIANNHTLDRGALGVDRTVENLEKSGMEFAGIRSRGSSESTARVVKIKGARFGFIACTEMTNGMKDNFNQVTKCGSGEVLKMISDLKSRTDGVIVFPHWGDEYQGRPNSRQRSWAQQWVKAGAMAIIGNHPHVLQTVEWIARPSGGQAVVVYSLGNFVAAQGAFEKRLSAIAHLDFGVTSQGLVVEQFSYTPTIRPRGSIAHLRADSDKTARLAAEKQLGPIRCVN